LTHGSGSLASSNESSQMHPRILPCLALCFFGACAPSEASPSAGLREKLRMCGLLTRGDVRPRESGALVDCLAQCRLSEDCDELEELYCEKHAQRRSSACENACYGPRSCASGHGSYKLSEVCDGVTECEDGTDEFGCAPYAPSPSACRNTGIPIWSLYRCNGVDDCGDGTDEEGCPGEAQMFDCAGPIRQRVPLTRVCDLVWDCLDGSDESAGAGCAQLSCPR